MSNSENAALLPSTCRGLVCCSVSSSGRLYDLWDSLPPGAPLLASALIFANQRLHVGYAWLPKELILYWRKRRTEADLGGVTINFVDEIVALEDVPTGKGHGKGKGSDEATLAKYVEWHFRKTVPPEESWRSISLWASDGVERKPELDRSTIKRNVREVERLLRLGAIVAGYLPHGANE